MLLILAHFQYHHLLDKEMSMAVIEKRRSTEHGTRYRVKIRLKGFPPQTATFERLTDAKRWAQLKWSQASRPKSQIFNL